MIPFHLGMNQKLSSFLLKNAFLTLKKLFHKSSFLSSHYDTLKVKTDCTSKEIRESFIKLSKKNHPDVNKNPNAHKEFLKIQEAYNVLGKPNSRAMYDLGRSRPRYSHRRGTYYAYSRTAPRYTSGSAWDDPSFYANRDKSQFKERPADSYYGFKGMKRVSNGTFALIVVAFATVAFMIQMVILRYVFMKQQNKMRQKSMELQALLNDLQETAEKNGNKKQVEIARQRFEAKERWEAEQKAMKK
ncbi:unnamed protein product [Ceutorhynchus assimilis]|uniref:J domain-containing protein n=1 Tax=Ceutorhynchus assimilis TaxID=467358 RepID=A0A9N9QKB4_9CUCU|nr:unnamed protein product [Ceutorhynchus assimilis]